MTQVYIKRVYDAPQKEDGFRVLADRLWPRGIKKENLKYDYWAKEITPSAPLRNWFHEDPSGRWETFSARYRQELKTSGAMPAFLEKIKPYAAVTLLYASREAVYNHARILQQYIEKEL